MRISVQAALNLNQTRQNTIFCNCNTEVRVLSTYTKNRSGQEFGSNHTLGMVTIPYEVCPSALILIIFGQPWNDIRIKITSSVVKCVQCVQCVSFKITSLSFHSLHPLTYFAPTFCTPFIISVGPQQLLKASCNSMSPARHQCTAAQYRVLC